MRISFTGELSYEINIESKYGHSLWKMCIEAGKEFNLTPYGTETMHLLRAEKGFIIVGQDTDGTMTPSDLQMDWIVSKKKYDFIGKRSLYRSDTIREDRKQLVGLLTDDPKEILEALMVRYIESQVYQGVVENAASEQAARMVAMKAATDNAGNLIDELQLVYNKARQAAITQEISEIVSGAAAV